MKQKKNRSLEVGVAEFGQFDEAVRDKGRGAQPGAARWLWLAVAAALIASAAIVINQRNRMARATSPPQLAAQEAVVVEVLKNQASTVMDELEIRLADIKMDDRSHNYRIDALISTPGNMAMELQDQEATTETTFFYPKNRKFKIKVLSVDRDSATFRVEKNKE